MVYATRVRPAEARRILVECFRRMERIARTPKPRCWWDVDVWEANRTLGPLYNSSTWFGEPRKEPLPAKVKVRLLRAIRALSEEGLLVLVRSEPGNVLQRLRLTEEGQRVARELLAEEEAGLAGGEVVQVGGEVVAAGRPAD